MTQEQDEMIDALLDHQEELSEKELGLLVIFQILEI